MSFSDKIYLCDQSKAKANRSVPPIHQSGLSTVIDCKDIGFWSRSNRKMGLEAEQKNGKFFAVFELARTIETISRMDPSQFDALPKLAAKVALRSSFLGMKNTDDCATQLGEVAMASDALACAALIEKLEWTVQREIQMLNAG